MTMTLSSRAMLVTLNISMWSARKLDRAESAELAAKRGAVDGAARVNKILLPNASSLDAVRKCETAIRTDYYRLTLPWAAGQGILRAEGYFGFQQIMSEHRAKWDSAVRQFIADYPRLRQDAQRMLNGLYRSEDYPDPRIVASKFLFDLSFLPVPDAGDWRVTLADDAVESIKQQIETRVKEAQGKAMREAWDRLYTVVSRAQERLSDPQNKFRDSLVENARDLCRVLPYLNIADDPNLEQMRCEVERHLCAYQPDVLREDETVRASVADKLSSIMEKMSSLYGAA